MFSSPLVVNHNYALVVQQSYSLTFGLHMMSLGRSERLTVSFSSALPSFGPNSFGSPLYLYCLLGQKIVIHQQYDRLVGF